MGFLLIDLAKVFVISSVINVETGMGFTCHIFVTGVDYIE